MELDLTPDQELLRASAARFMDASCPTTVVRQLFDSVTGLPENYLHDAAELGWFAPLVPEELGGGSVSGEGLCDLAVIAEERGRRLQPGPFTPMNVVADALAAEGPATPHAEVLSALCRGEVAATWVTGDAFGPVGHRNLHHCRTWTS